jgi:hypothetical protein
LAPAANGFTVADLTGRVHTLDPASDHITLKQP